MKECPVCGDSDYNEVAGHFYCTTCNTQSQNFRVEEVDTDVIAGWTGHADVIREKKTPTEKKKRKVDKGQPWSIYEAYQIILLRQVEALIELGARQELKEIVFKLWTNYLAHLGVAFSDKGPDKKLKQYERQRELFPGTTKNPKIKNILGRSRKRKSYGASTKQAEKEMEQDLVEDALRGEEFDEEDTAQQDDDNEESDSNDDIDIDDDDVIELELLDNKKRRALHSKSVFKMKMIYTVGICYLGLRVTNPLTTVVDMIRWIKQDKLPYLNADKLIGSTMKCYINDWKLFGMGKVPTIERLRSATITLGKTLHVDNKATESFPFSQLIHKYIVQLDLPAELHRCMAAIDIKTSLRYQKNFYIPYWEVKAMAHIVVLLKLVFGVNDHSERIFSKYSKDLNLKLYGGNQQLFVWSKWISHVAEKIDTMDINTRDVDVVEEADIAERLGRQTKTNTLTIPKNKLYTKKIRETIQKQLNELSETMKSGRKGGNSQQATERETESDRSDGEDEVDLHSNTLMDDDPVGYLLGRSDNEEEQELPPLAQKSHKSAQLEKIKQRGELFRQSSMQHILSPEEFLDTCKTRQIRDNIARISDSDIIKNPDYLVSESDWDSQAEASSVSYFGLDKRKYKHVMQQCGRTKKHYMVATEPRDMAQEPAAYNWLIHLFSKFIYSTPSKLQAEVNRVEQQITI